MDSLVDYRKDKEYMLCRNKLYNATHVFKVRWYHKIFGLPSTFIDMCLAPDKDQARIKFKSAGHNVGIGF